MVRSLQQKKPAFRRSSWTPEEDRKLITYIQRYGIWNWSQMPKFAGLKRSGKSCRLRWLNYLSPDVKRGNITEEEEETIISLYEKMGSRWSAIAKELPGRTDNEIKNYFHTNLKKQLMNNLVPRVKPQAVETLACKAIKENLQENNASLLNNGVEISNTAGPSNFHAQSNESGTGSSSTLDWGFEVFFGSDNLDTGLSGENFGDSQISWGQPFLMENLSMEGPPSGICTFRLLFSTMVTRAHKPLVRLLQ